MMLDIIKIKLIVINKMIYIARVVYNTYRGNQYSQWINYETPRYDQYNQN